MDKYTKINEMIEELERKILFRNKWNDNILITNKPKKRGEQLKPLLFFYTFFLF